MNPLIKDRPAPTRPAGAGKGAWLAALEKSAGLLQGSPPLRRFDVYLVGFHCAKGAPGLQMEAHHYCRVVNDDFLQCILFDGNTEDANLVGVEYIVSEDLFGTLSQTERAFWHPHNFEVLSGQLIAPGLPIAAETAFMKRLVNSYGKTWHTWRTGRHDLDGGHDLPVGGPMLMWSFNREGECDEELVRSRDTAMGFDPDERRRHRLEHLDLAHPQEGVDVLDGRFGRVTSSLPGVVDAAALTGERTTP